MSNRLKGKWALVTGASSGFGAETARQFADMGVNLLLGARREDRLKQVAAECLEVDEFRDDGRHHFFHHGKGAQQDAQRDDGVDQQRQQ